MPGSLANLETTLTSVVDKLDKIPFETIAKDLQVALRQLDSALKAAEQLVQRVDTELTPEAKDALVEAKRAIAAAGRSWQAIPRCRKMRVRHCARSRARQGRCAVLTDYLERHPESLIRGKRAEEKP